MSSVLTLPVPWTDVNEKGLKGVIEIHCSDLRRQSFISSRVCDLMALVDEKLQALPEHTTCIRSASAFYLHGSRVSDDRLVESLIPDLESSAPRLVVAVKARPKITKVKRLAVFVMALTRRSVPIACTFEDLVGDVKTLVRDKGHVPIDDQRLMYGSKQLEDSRKLSFYKIQNGSSLELVARVRGGFSGGSAASRSFVDVSHGSKLTELDFSAVGPHWQRCTKGLNVEGVCRNAACRAFGQGVIHCVGFEYFNLMKEKDVYCPACHTAFKPTTCGFYDCAWKFEGIKTSECLSIASRWKEAKGQKYHRFDDRCHSVDWSSLLIMAKPLEDTKAAKLTRSETNVSSKEVCTVCWKAVGSPFESSTMKVDCGHTFHRQVSRMDRLDAMEEEARPRGVRQGDFDVVESQVWFVQQKLRQVWQRKRGRRGDDVPCVPFYWVFSKLLRLMEAYPDGLTEAVVVTELTSLLKQKEHDEAEHGAGMSRKKQQRVRHVQDTGELVAQGKEKALQAQVQGYRNHRLTLDMQDATAGTAHMYLHARFRSCIDFLHKTWQHEPNGCVFGRSTLLSWNEGVTSGGCAVLVVVSSVATFPFQSDREVVFTNAKLLERKEVNVRPMDGELNRVKFTLLPTSFLIVRLDEDNVLDRKLVAEAMTLSQVDQLVGEAQEPTRLQVVMLKARVLDIGAIRPCQTPLHVHRQVILLGEVDQITAGLPAEETSATQRLTQGLHFMVLWDEQVALSRLFHVDNILTIFHPFVHVCGHHDTEMLHILNEYSSQQPLAYYFEYGSATVLFSKSCQVSSMDNSTTTSAILQGHCEMERPLSQLDDIQAGWHDFSLYAHVRSIKVSHGIPLLAAFFYAYYDSKTNEPGLLHAKRLPPPLDHTIGSKYYLVVMLQVYTASSERLLTIEVTGENALAALRLHPGQSVFFDGLLALDIQSMPVRRFRERRLMPLASASTTRTEFAFATKAYHTSSSSSVVVLCSDWESIFGKQSLCNNSSKLKVVNTTPGLLNTVLDRSAAFHNVAPHALTIVEMTVAGAGWLIPDPQGFTIDTTCVKGHSTMCAHKSCFRPLELMTSEPRMAGSPKWKCLFCEEVFFGLQDTVQTFSEMAITLENGRSRTCPLVVLCHGDTLETFLGLTAAAYAELPLATKRETLECLHGTSFRFVLSRCEPRRVYLPSPPSSSSSYPSQLDPSATIHVRIDLMHPIDPFRAAHLLLENLHHGM